jgi:hypothetical protein
VPNGTIALPVWQAALTANNTEDLLVTGLTLQQTSGAAGIFGAVRLYWDANGDGLLDASDVAISPAGTLTGTPAQVVWTLNQRISAGTTQYLLAVADVAGSLGQTGDVGVLAGGLSMQGLASGLTEQNGLGLNGLPQTGGTVTVGAAGSVTVYLGTQSSPSRTEPAGTTGIPLTQITLRGSVAEAATVNSVTVTHFGTGTTTDVSQLQLWDDANGNGRVDAGETSLGTATLSGTPAQATFNSLGTLTVPAGGDLHLVVTYDLASGAGAGGTFRTQIFANTDVSVTGQTSSSALPVAGAPVMGNQLTVGTAEELLVSAGSNWPAPRFLPPASLPQGNVAMATLRLEATTGGTGINVTALQLWPSGTGDDRLVTVEVWDESTGTTPGAVDAGDTLLGTAAGFPGDNQPWTLSLSPAVGITAGSSTQWLVTYDVLHLRAAGAARLRRAGHRHDQRHGRPGQRSRAAELHHHRGGPAVLLRAGGAAVGQQGRRLLRRDGGGGLRLVAGGRPHPGPRHPAAGRDRDRLLPHQPARGGGRGGPSRGGGRCARRLGALRRLGRRGLGGGTSHASDARRFGRDGHAPAAGGGRGVGRSSEPRSLSGDAGLRACIARVF